MTPDKAPSRPVSAPESVPGTPGHPDPATGLQERRARYAEAIRVGPGRNLAVDEVIKVADAELAGAHAAWKSDRLYIRKLTAEADGLKAEVERLRAPLETIAGRQRDAALETIANLTSEQDNLTTERDEARATIGRVKKLAESWDDPYPSVVLAAIRAALDAPTEPAPDLEVRLPIPPEEIAEWDGYGRHLAADVGVTVHDPPPDPLAAIRARIQAAADRMGPST